MNLWDKDGKHILACTCGCTMFDEIGDKVVCRSCREKFAKKEAEK